MKKSLLKVLVLTIGLFWSCAKNYDEDIETLKRRVSNLEDTGTIATVDKQVEAIKVSITDLEAADAAINGRIDGLKTVVDAQQALIDALKTADGALGKKDEALENHISTLESQTTTLKSQIENLITEDTAIKKRIEDLTSYVNGEIKKTTDWANATFATMSQYYGTADDLASLSSTVSGINATLTQVQTDISTLNARTGGSDVSTLDAKVDATKTELEGKIGTLKTELEGDIATAVSNSEASIQGWVNTQLGGYWTATLAEQKLTDLQNSLNTAIAAGDQQNADKIEEAQTKITALKDSLATTKTQLTAAYTQAISDAINQFDGTIVDQIRTDLTAANAQINALAASVSTLEADVAALKARMDTAEGKINDIEGQITAINTSIADLATIRTNLAAAMTDIATQGNDITALKAEDIALGQRIDDLKSYVNDTLSAYAKTDWVNATFATLTQYQQTADNLAALQTTVSGLSGDITTTIQDQITASKSTIEGWISADLLGDYWTAAETQAKLDVLKARLDSTIAAGGQQTDDIAAAQAQITALDAELDAAKAELTAAYTSAIETAITANGGYVTTTIKTAIETANTGITDLTTRVETLETDITQLKTDVADLKAMIQEVTVIPAYSDGSVKAEGGILSMDCLVDPASAVSGLGKDSVKVLVNTVETKAISIVSVDVTEFSSDITAGSISIKADISAYIPTESGKSLTVALKIANGISKHTTEFVKVGMAAGPVPALPNGALQGTFSVSPTKKVYFSRGNLYYDGRHWKFEFNQYDFRTYTNLYSCRSGFVSDHGTPANHWGTFGWVGASSTTLTSNDTRYGVSTSETSSDYGRVAGESLKSDWGVAYCQSNDITPTTTWRTLSKDEWEYLLGSSSERSGKYKINVTICEVPNCLVIAPDNFTGTIADFYSAATWAFAEASGLVCLPVSGYRQGKGSSLGIYNTTTGKYWTSTADDGNNSFYLGFGGGGSVSVNHSSTRSYGYSVRLVTDAPAD